MLVLTRKAGETIRISENIVIKVIRTGKGAVKIGIEAPSDVRVMRGELLPESKVEPAPAIPAAIVGRVISDQYPHVA
ncbi:MAG: carbon storage regulator [Planctomyces sp.]|jgi:carbon storage regulator